MTSHFESATCPNCQTYFDRLPVDGDEDGNAYVALEVTPCATCGEMLCPCCSQFVCEHGATHCTTHLVEVDGIKACPVCLEQMAESDAEVGAICPDCGSLEVVGEIFQGGEPGYQEDDELYRCLICGSRGPAEDAERAAVALPPRKGAQSERAAAAAKTA